MCLSHVDGVLDPPVDGIGYKVYEHFNGNYEEPEAVCPYFCIRIGNEPTYRVVFDVPLNATLKPVEFEEGEYISGFHILATLDDAKLYVKDGSFYRPVICRVQYSGARLRGSEGDVHILIADHMTILKPRPEDY